MPLSQSSSARRLRQELAPPAAAPAIYPRRDIWPQPPGRLAATVPAASRRRCQPPTAS